MPARDWKFLSRTPVSEHRIFSLHYDRYRLETSGNEQEFVVIDSPDWVNVIPITPQGEIVMIRQYRHGVRKDTLEIPGGLIDPGEAPLDAARRELHEETGYEADSLRLLGEAFPNPAVQNNTLYCYLAEGVRLTRAPDPDPFERIEVELVPLARLPELVRRGEVGHALVMVAFGFLGLWAEPRA